MTSYRLAQSTLDYQDAHRMIRDFNFPDPPIRFPTILAEDGGKLVGVLGTRISDNMIVAGPLVLSDDRPRIRTAMRMAELYQITMKGLGITTFIFHTQVGGVVDRFIERYTNVKPYIIRGDEKFFTWRIT